MAHTLFLIDGTTYPQDHEQHAESAPTTSHAGGESHGFDPLAPSPGLAFWSVVTFVVLFIVLAKFAWKPILATVDAREKKIRDDIGGAERARAESEATLKRYEAQLADAAMKARDTVEAARVRAEQAAAEIATQAKADAEATLVRARAQIEQDKQKALQDIKTSVVELSMAITREVVKRTAAQEDHAAIAGDLLKRMKDVG